MNVPMVSALVVIVCAVMAFLVGFSQGRYPKN